VKCAGCDRELEAGDRYIEDTAGGFFGVGTHPEVDTVMGELLSGRVDGRMVFCEDCTTPGGTYEFKSYDGDEEQER